MISDQCPPFCFEGWVGWVLLAGLAPKQLLVHLLVELAKLQPPPCVPFYANCTLLFRALTDVSHSVTSSANFCGPWRIAMAELSMELGWLPETACSSAP